MPIGRKVICIDQNPDYVQTMNDELSELRRDSGWESDVMKVIQHDSRDLNFIDDESVDLIVTSPPYWNKADYGVSPNNLGAIETYAAFISSMRPVFEECYRVLAPGRKVCLVTANVNQHTDHGLLTFPLAADFSMSLRDVGFVMVNEIVWSKHGSGGKWGSYGQQRPIFGSYPYPPNLLFKNVHEYVLIFSKPGVKKTRGPKVKMYEDLMKGLGRCETQVNSH